MPYVHIQITKEGGPEGNGPTKEQKQQLIRGVTLLLEEGLGKSPNTTHVVITEVEMDNWGVGGMQVLDFRSSQD